MRLRLSPIFNQSLLLLGLLSSLLCLPASADFWDLNELSNQDWQEAENAYVQQRMRDANRLREKVEYIGRKNGGLILKEEYSHDNLEGGATQVYFETLNGYSCQASVSSEKVACEKEGVRYSVGRFGWMWQE